MKAMRSLALVALTLGLFSSVSSAQTALNSTTLAAAVAANATQVRLTSVTNVSANDVIYVDQEAMRVRSVNSPYVSVSRGIDGTRAVAHNTLGTVYTGASIRFAQPRPTRGSCTRTAETYLPRVVPSVGETWDCLSGAGVWALLNGSAPAQIISCRALLIADMVDQSCFTADRTYLITKITYVAKVAEAGGTLTLIPRREQGTEAAASGDALATAINCVTSGTAAETVATATLTTTTSDLILYAGDRFGLDFTDDSAGELAGVTVTVTLMPQ